MYFIFPIVIPIVILYRP